MKFLFDLFPVLLFFVAYKIAGIYTATAAAMVAALTQIAWVWFQKRQLETMQVVTMLLILVLGSATLIFKNPLFIKWKPTAVYWLFALAFAASQFVGNKQPAISRMMGEQLNLDPKTWITLNRSWIFFFAAVGLLNILVAYQAPESTWVNFKLFGITGLTLCFVVIQAIFLAKHNKQQSPAADA